MSIIASIVFVLFLLYWIPTAVAAVRGHHSLFKLWLVNLLLGWTVVGWIVCLVWAFRNPA